MRACLYKSARRKLADRLAHRRARHAEAARKLHLVERLAWRERAAHDVVGKLRAQFLGARLAQDGRACLALGNQLGHARASAGRSMTLT